MRIRLLFLGLAGVFFYLSYRGAIDPDFLNTGWWFPFAMGVLIIYYVVGMTVIIQKYGRF